MLPKMRYIKEDELWAFQPPEARSGDTLGEIHYGLLKCDLIVLQAEQFVFH